MLLLLRGNAAAACAPAYVLYTSLQEVLHLRDEMAGLLIPSHWALVGTVHIATTSTAQVHLCMQRCPDLHAPRVKHATV